MSFEDIINQFIPDNELNEDRVIELFKTALKGLNTIQLYRLKADAFAHNAVSDEYYNFDAFEDFEKKYLSFGIYVMQELYESNKVSQSILVEISLCGFYSLLASYINKKNYNDEEIELLVKENDSFKEVDVDENI